MVRFEDMLKFLFSILILSIMSCSKNMTDSNYTPTGTTTDPQVVNAELTQLVQAFSTQYGVSVSYSVSLDSGGVKTGTTTSGGTIIGLCEIYSDGSRYVYINQDWFSRSSTLSFHKRILVYHELGHCSFNRSHDSRMYTKPNSYDSYNVPFSIMYPSVNPIIYWYNTYSSYFLQELGDSTTAGTLSGLTQAPLIDFGNLNKISFPMTLDNEGNINCE